MNIDKCVCKSLLMALLWLPFAFMLFGCDKEIIEPTPVVELHSGYSTQLHASSNGVQWGSDDTSVATVTSTGLVTAIGAGKTVIYTYSSSGVQSIVCYLEVLPKRNILFYIATDEGLTIDGDAPEKIDQVREGWCPGKGEMIIYVDRMGQQGSYLLRVNETKDANGRYGLDTLYYPYGEENSADPEVLSRVVNRVIQDFPADSYGMIFFSHGSGWLPEGTLSRPRSLVIDNNNGGGKNNKEMEYYDFAAAIPDKQFDFIILEACLMADVMFMYELRNKAEYVLASSAEIVTPGFGGNNSIVTNTYKDEIMGLYNTNGNVKDVVSGFAQSYCDYMMLKYSEYNFYCFTLSLIDMGEMNNLASVTKSILRGKSIDETFLIVDSIQHFDRPRSNQVVSGYGRSNKYFDFAHTIKNLVSDSEYKVFDDQMKKTVVWSAATKSFLLSDYGFYINHHSGLTTYIEQSVFPFLNSKYKESSWYKAIL